MKHDLKDQNAERFTRNLIKTFGKTSAKQILHFLLERSEETDMADMKKLAIDSLIELNKHLTNQDYN